MIDDNMLKQRKKASLSPQKYTLKQGTGIRLEFFIYKCQLINTKELVDIKIIILKL